MLQSIHVLGKFGVCVLQNDRFDLDDPNSSEFQMSSPPFLVEGPFHWLINYLRIKILII